MKINSNITSHTSAFNTASEVVIRGSRHGFIALLILLGMIGTRPTYARETQTANRQAWEARAIFGFDRADSTSLTTSLPAESKTGDLDFGSGFAFGGAIGYNFPNNFLLELEYTWRSSGEGDAPDALFGPGAETDVASVMISPNLWYKPTLESMPKLAPRFGITYGWLQEVSMDATVGGIEESFDGDGAGWMLMAGLDWDLNDRWLLGLDARYYDGGGITATSEMDPTRKVSFDYSGLTINLQIGYRF